MGKEIVIVSAARTAIGNFNGSLKDISAPELGAIVIKEVLQRAGVKAGLVDEVIMGNVLQAGVGQNPARQAAIKAGLPVQVSAMTINKVCGSGLKAVHLACQSILAGDADIIVAGGMENMSQAPYLLKKARNGFKMGNQQLVDSMITDGLWCAINDYHMGITAENLYDQYSISREQQDQYAALSQQKAFLAINEGRFSDEIVPIIISQKKGDFIVFKEDEFPRRDTTAEKLSKLPAAFKNAGSVTAGNSSGINDGAAAVLVMSKKKALELGIPVIATIKANATAGVDPSIMGIGPVPAVNKVLNKSNLKMEDISLIEANEAFAVQTLAVGKELNINSEILNVNGGAIALGHPIGASGARILVTLIYEMKRRNAKRGLATLCIGGGEGIATLVELS